mmetsp:Transcript_45677/g.141307  ORF Transcript_45677/g.141307 Transcript_45677/m.141307 type:complete len:239 (-) Transcript_45677:26-742(-)
MSCTRRASLGSGTSSQPTSWPPFWPACSPLAESPPRSSSSSCTGASRAPPRPRASTSRASRSCSSRTCRCLRTTPSSWTVRSASSTSRWHPLPPCLPSRGSTPTLWPEGSSTNTFSGGFPRLRRSTPQSTTAAGPCSRSGRPRSRAWPPCSHARSWSTCSRGGATGRARPWRGSPTSSSSRSACGNSPPTGAASCTCPRPRWLPSFWAMSCTLPCVGLSKLLWSCPRKHNSWHSCARP